MPQILVMVAAYAIDAIIAASPGLIAAIGTTGAAIVGGLAAAGFGYIAQLFLTKAPKNTLSLREAISTHKLVEGQMKVGGAITFIDTSSDNKTLRFVVTFCAKPVFSIDGIYINDVYVPLKRNGNGWDAQKPDKLPDGTRPTDFTAHVSVAFGLGTVAGDADFINSMSQEFGPDFSGTLTLSEILFGTTNSKWASNFYQYGRAKIAVQLQWSTNLFGSTGVPNVSVVTRGRMVVDPRDTATVIATSAAGAPGVITTSTAHGLQPGNMVFIRGHSGAVVTNAQPAWPAAQRINIAQEYEVNTAPSSTTLTLLGADSQPLGVTTGGTGGTIVRMWWTDNSELLTRDYIVDPYHGLSAIYDQEVDETQMISNANLCDEIVPRVLPTAVFTADPTTNIIFWEPNQPAGDLPRMCQAVLSTTGTLPSGLNPSQVYYYAQAGGANGGYLCTSAQNAANIPPSFVNFSDAGTGTHTLTIVETFTANATTDTLTVYSNTLRVTTGTQVQVSNSGGALPSGLSAATNYYGIFLTDMLVQIAATLEDARHGNAINLLDAGSGTSFIEVTAEPRYTANGLVDTAESRQQVLQKLLSSMGGYLVPVGITLGIFPAVYRTPTVTFDEGDLRGPIQVTTLMSGGTSFNSVKGTFVDPFNKGQPTDYPFVQNSTYIAADQGEVIWKDLTLEFTNSASMAQRLAKIELERARRELTVNMPLKFTAFPVGTPDVVMVNNIMWGWSAETFELNSWLFSAENGDDRVPVLGCDVVARQTDSAVFAWTSAEEAAAKRQSNTTLPNPFVVQPPTNLALTSGNATLYVRADGTVFSRILATWTLADDQFVQDGGFYETVYKQSADTVWSKADVVAGSETFVYILDVLDSVPYDVEVRSRNAIGAVSDDGDAHPWQASVRGFLAQGKSQAPSDVPGMTVTQNELLVILSGSPVPDADVVAFEYRYGATANWATMLLIEAPHARPDANGNEVAICTTAAVPAGSWWFGVKAKDSSGNYSNDAFFVQKAISSSSLVTILDQKNDPGWANLGVGTGTGFLRHWTGVLIPNSTVTASSMSDADLWNTFNSAPVSSAIYECPLIDLGSAEVVTVFFNPATYFAGPGVVGSPTVVFEIDSWPSGSDPGTWTAGTVFNVTARFIKMRIRETPGSVPAVVANATVEVDSTPTAAQTGTQVCAGGGTAVTFSPAFHSTPDITATAQGANVAWVTSPSSTGFTLHVGPTTTTDTGGTASWSASGS